MGEIEIFSFRIRELRESIGMTQKGFSEYIGVKQQTLSGYERSVMKPPLDVAKNIAEKCNVSIDWLCGLSEQKKYSEEILTYADMFRLIAKLCSLRGISDDWEVLFQSYDDDFSRTRTECALLRSSDSRISSFFKDWEQMYSLYKEHTIDEHLYNLWLSDKIKQYEDCPICPPGGDKALFSD